MDLAKWFHDQLQSSADAFVWAVEQVPSRRLYLPPPPALGEWSAARHAFHLLYYERSIALPSMRQWLGEPLPGMAGVNEVAAWQVGHDLTEVIEDFNAVRVEQIALLPQYAEFAWEELRQTIWDRQTLRWVLSKTFQHTAEHTHDVLSIALFWDHLRRGW